MQHFDYKPHGVCPMRISFDLEGDTVHNVSFTGGCNGNLQAISRVVEGMTVDQIEGYFRGIARLWRQGQQSRTVVIHHLVSAGTIDEDIMKVLKMKDKTQAAMMRAVKARGKA